MQRQFTREFNISSSNKPSKKAPSMGSGNRGGRPGHLPQVTPWKKGPQEKLPGGAISKVILGRKPQACLSGGPLALDSFPPILGLPVLGRTKYSLVAPGARQPKQNTGKPPGASRTRDSDLVAQGDGNRGKEPVPKRQDTTGGFGYSELQLQVQRLHQALERVMAPGSAEWRRLHHLTLLQRWGFWDQPGHERLHELHDSQRNQGKLGL
ncbi:hypothetical protein E5288_WYG008311 [Bos mutus]|uniref:Uncharacterized protein n=1 Tax=Bos mutus TaxID=72004 RepID=A0A6B0SB35_9CETA|nr:hypothetical protein [Bos mutus]